MKNNSLINKIDSELNSVLSRHIGRDLNAIVLQQISKDMEKVLNHYIVGKVSDVVEFPLKFENAFGSWEIHSDGNVLFAPRKKVEYIECNITITKTEE
jgi:hypothetical protein